MKQIKFRVWNGEEMISPDYIKRDGSAWWSENSIPETSDKVMQFTGLLDKNGKEIYEGDIVDVNMGISAGGYNSIGEYEPEQEIRYKRTVEWVDKYACFNWVGNPGGSILCEGNRKYYEVVGNIYQPELLTP